MPVKPKHPRAIRWFHWIHFPLIALMIWSGILIYWANDVYRIGFGSVTLFHFFPDAVYGALGLHHRLAEGMAYHFFLMWLFAINGLAYVSYLALSGEWRQLIPDRLAFREAWRVFLHDLKLSRAAPPLRGTYNGAQRIAYTGVVLMGAGSLLTGLGIYKPVQLSWLTHALGGYEAARFEHFWLTMGYLVFFVIHVAQVARAGWSNFRSMIGGFETTPPVSASDSAWIARRARRSFLKGGVVAALGFAGFGWLRSRRDAEGVPWPLRRVLDLNGDLWRDYSRAERLSPSFPAPPVGKKPRFNGDLGLAKDGFDPSKWRLRVAAQDPDDEPLELTMADLRLLPRSSTTTEFKCIEGWSEIISYSGVRFSDFMKHFELGYRPDGRAYRYVGLETPDRRYYVSIDMDSMLHPQTMLVDEMNGLPLSPEEGAPLRLWIPIKYGIKSLKRIGAIRFSDTRPPDYWAERGYDWFAGL